jgi:hypothetical protein
MYVHEKQREVMNNNVQRTAIRIARFSNQKIPIWVNCGGYCNGRCGYICGYLVYFKAIWYILRSFGIFYGHLVYFMVIWYILWSFGIFYGHLVYFMVIWYVFPVFGMLQQEILATLNCLGRLAAKCLL